MDPLERCSCRHTFGAHLAAGGCDVCPCPKKGTFVPRPVMGRSFHAVASEE